MKKTITFDAKCRQCMHFSKKIRGVARKMKVVIERKDSFDGYVVTCEDGRVFEAETIIEAIELKEELQNEN